MRHALAPRAVLAAAFAATLATGLATGVATGPALASQSRVELVNRSSVAVAQLVVFHVRADGSIIDDVVGGLYDPIAPGRSAELVLNVPCGPISAYVRLANETELSARLDTCRDRQIVVRD